MANWSMERTIQQRRQRWQWLIYAAGDREQNIIVTYVHVGALIRIQLTFRVAYLPTYSAARFILVKKWTNCEDQ